MKYTFSVIILLLIYSCSHNYDQNSSEVIKEEDSLIEDTIVKKLDTKYFAVINNDTSSFMVNVYSNQKNNEIHISLSPSKSLSYSQQFNEFKTILSAIAEEYDMKLLKSIYLSRLILHGDLAVKTTKEINIKYGDLKSFLSCGHPEIGVFLKTGTTLGKDLDRLLLPYSKTVNQIHTEMDMYAKRESFKYHNVLLTDTTEIPEIIFDSQITVDIESIKP